MRWGRSEARAVGEKPEDVVWFFQVGEPARSMDEPMGDDEAWEVIVKDRKAVGTSTGDLLETAREELKKFRRIERKMKKLGVI